jgi:transcriptional regulator with XRE-family HTH domain
MEEKSNNLNSLSDKFIIFAFKLKLLEMADLNRIKVVLVEKKRTGKWLAGELGKSSCTVSKWCSNTAQPDLRTLDQIARLLEVDVKDLLNSTEKRQ